MTDSPVTPRTALHAYLDTADPIVAETAIALLDVELAEALADSDAGPATRSYIGRVRDTEERLIAESLRTDAGPTGIDVERLARAFDAHPGPARASDNIAHDRGHHGDECWQQIAAEYARLSRESDR
jgi:hypothetical protein